MNFEHSPEQVQLRKTVREFAEAELAPHVLEWDEGHSQPLGQAGQIDAARLLTLRAAWMKDRGERVTKEAAIAKLYASEAAAEVCGEAVQVLGGYGFIKEYRVEKFYRDVKLCTIGEGTSEIQRLVIARQLLKG